MVPSKDNDYVLSPAVAGAINRNAPILAFESAVITHGLPFPHNFEIAREMQSIATNAGISPATIALLSGKIHLGLDTTQLEQLANWKDPIKVSSRDIGIGIAKKETGGTTVAATLAMATKFGIKVFATGGIGGVHRGNQMDVSADLDVLAKSPVIVVCAGAKSILDLPATLEALETRSVPVLGWKTKEFPAFYSRSSGLKVNTRVESVSEIVEIAIAHWNAGSTSALLVCQPLDENLALDSKLVESAVESAKKVAEQNQISGSGLTPFLLTKVSEFTKGKSLIANLKLLKNNAALASEISKCIYSKQYIQHWDM
jgi:pseudouridylate synthase